MLVTDRGDSYCVKSPMHHLYRYFVQYSEFGQDALSQDTRTAAGTTVVHFVHVTILTPYAYSSPGSLHTALD